MRKKKILMMLALLLTAVTGAWADEWDAVYTMTQTTSSNWTALDAGSTTGQTLGSAGTTTYYYVNSNPDHPRHGVSLHPLRQDDYLHGNQC